MFKKYYHFTYIQREEGKRERERERENLEFFFKKNREVTRSRDKSTYLFLQSCNLECEKKSVGECEVRTDKK